MRSTTPSHCGWTALLARFCLGLTGLLALAAASSNSGCGGGSNGFTKPSGGTNGPDIFWVETTGSDFNPQGTAGAPWLTINRALMVAGPGDVIMVGAGTFPERNVVQPFVEIRGSGVGVTFIDGVGDGPVFTFQPGAQLGNSGLKDLTIINGKGDDTRGIIYIKRGSPTINNVTVTGGDAYGSTTASVVQIEGWGSPLINNLTINTCNGTAGQVVAVRGNGIVTPTITNLTTTAGGVDGGLVLSEGALFTISGSLIRPASLPAAVLSDAAHLNASSSTFSSTGDDALFLKDSTGADLSICTVGPAGGHGLHLTNAAQASLTRTRITQATGDGIFMDTSAAVSAVNSIVDHNTLSGVFLTDGTGGPGSSFIHCTISDNTVKGLQTGTTGTGKLYVFNSLITYNGTLATDQVSGTQWDINHTGLTDATGTGGTNVTMANPQYANKAAGDYSILKATSPAVDIGDPNIGSPPGSAVPTVDFAGAARDGSNNPDAGAHEGL
ncbi:MAG TPA: right-handed parallel beta-helix repeat-containing protein [Planctomycetota bacterium]|nr:right-handed parallel beta-helix repeat-containing protein [Planctomycetota bacterium]